MLNLSEENKALCFSDSVSKPLYIFLYFLQGYDQKGHANWRYFKTIDNAIVLESMSIDEGILEGDTFELGSFIVPTIKVKWRNDGIRYKDMVAVPVQKIGTQYIAYFDGYISNEEVSNDGQTVSAEIVSFLGERLNIDVLGTVKAYNGGTFYEMVKNALGLTADIWIKGSETDELLKKFPNANTVITLDENTLPKTLTASKLLKQSGEFLGAHIVLKEKRIVNIDDMTNYQPVVTPTIDFIRISNVDDIAKQNQIRQLPNGYKPAPYVHFSGEQYINTGIVPTATTNAEYVVDIQKYKTYGPLILSTENFYFPFIRMYSGKAAVNWNRFGNSPSSDVDKGGYSNLFKAKAFFNDSVEFNNVVHTGITSGTAMPINPLYLGTYGGEPNNPEFSLVGDVYYCKIYDGDTVVRDFVPAIRMSDNKVGFYDFANSTFYTNNGSGDFSTPNSINTYTLPYYINIFSDKTNRLKFDALSVFTEVGERRNYTKFWSDKVYNTFEIKNNIFFNALSAQSSDACFNAVNDVASYVANQDFYQSDIECIYPLFIEGGDYLIIKSKNQRLLPNEYLVLDNITLSNKNGTNFIDTHIHPNSDDIELNIEFALLGGTTIIFTADARELGYDTLTLFASSSSLKGYIGYYGGSIQLVAFEIPYVPLNQKINFNLKCGKQQYQYRGTFIGNGDYYGGNTIDTDDVSLNLGNSQGSVVNYKLYHFAYSQNGVKMCDMYPCMRKSDGVVGVYDIVQNIFEPISGSATPKYEYETADIVVPALSATTRGIHSMRANILCKAVNSNNK